MKMKLKPCFTPALAVVLASGLAIFGLLAGQLGAHWLQALDASVAGWLSHAPASYLTFSRWVDVGGKGGPMGLLAFAIAAWLWRRNRYDALLVVVAPAGAWCWNEILKTLIARPRPPLLGRLVEASGPSFPSGHAMAAAALWGGLAWLASRRLACLPRAALWALLSVWLAATALTRPALGVHYFTDVAAGTAAGLAWLALCLAWRRGQDKRLFE